MRITKTAVIDTKHHKVPNYTVSIEPDELDEIYAKLFGGLNNISNVSNTIKDKLLEDYIKTYVVNSFVGKVELERSVIYKLEVYAKNLDMTIMVSLHDKLDQIFY